MGNLRILSRCVSVCISLYYPIFIKFSKLEKEFFPDLYSNPRQKKHPGEDWGTKDEVYNFTWDLRVQKTWLFIGMRVFNFLFWNNCRLPRNCKNSGETPYTYNPVSPMVILTYLWYTTKVKYFLKSKVLTSYNAIYKTIQYILLTFCLLTFIFNFKL